VSTAIIGPRLPHHLDDALGSADVQLSTDVLDAIDALCAPGTDVVPSDAAPYNADMRRAARRRRRG
jgi:hypothetical protein